MVASGGGGGGVAVGVAQVVPVEVIDPYDLLEAVEVLSKLPADFYDKLVRVALRAGCIGLNMHGVKLTTTITKL